MSKGWALGAGLCKSRGDSTLAQHFWKFPLWRDESAGVETGNLKQWKMDDFQRGQFVFALSSFRLPLQAAPLPGRPAKGPIVHSPEAMAS